MCIFLSRLKLPVFEFTSNKITLWFIYLVLTAAKREWPIAAFPFRWVVGYGLQLPRGSSFASLLMLISCVVHPKGSRSTRWNTEYGVLRHKRQFKHYCDVCLTHSKDLARGKWLIYSRTRLPFGLWCYNWEKCVPMYQVLLRLWSECIL